MSVERSIEAWEEVQRHGIDLADRLSQGFTGLIQSHISPPSFNWPGPQPTKLFDMEFSTQAFAKHDFGLVRDSSAINGVSAIFDIGNRLGQAGVDFGASVNGVVQQFFRMLPVPFLNDGNIVSSLETELQNKRNDMVVNMEANLGSLTKRFKEYGFAENDVFTCVSTEEDMAEYKKTAGYFGRSQGSMNITSTYDSRNHDVESTLVARGDMWRVEASVGSSSSRNVSSSPFLLQLGPVLLVRDSTLLLPVHLSKQHLLWYGYDRKSFMDLQFPNGQVTYVAGEGISTSAFIPFCGGLLQAQGQYPGDMRFSFSYKNKWGTRITPTVQLPDKSFSMTFDQALAWQRSGLILRPKFQLSVCPTFGGSNPGLQAEVIHSLKEQVNLIYGCSYMDHPSVFASLSLGRSKWNGNVGNSGIVVRLETPLMDAGLPFLSIQLNSGLEF